MSRETVVDNPALYIQKFLDEKFPGQRLKAKGEVVAKDTRGEITIDCDNYTMQREGQAVHGGLDDFDDFKMHIEGLCGSKLEYVSGGRQQQDASVQRDAQLARDLEQKTREEEEKRQPQIAADEALTRGLATPESAIKNLRQDQEIDWEDFVYLLKTFGGGVVSDFAYKKEDGTFHNQGFEPIKKVTAKGDDQPIDIVPINNGAGGHIVVLMIDHAEKKIIACDPKGNFGPTLGLVDDQGSLDSAKVKRTFCGEGFESYEVVDPTRVERAADGSVDRLPIQADDDAINCGVLCVGFVDHYVRSNNTNYVTTQSKDGSEIRKSMLDKIIKSEAEKFIANLLKLGREEMVLDFDCTLTKYHLGYGEMAELMDGEVALKTGVTLDQAKELFADFDLLQEIFKQARTAGIKIKILTRGRSATAKSILEKVDLLQYIDKEKVVDKRITSEKSIYTGRDISDSRNISKNYFFQTGGAYCDPSKTYYLDDCPEIDEANKYSAAKSQGVVVGEGLASIDRSKVDNLKSGRIARDGIGLTCGNLAKINQHLEGLVVAKKKVVQSSEAERQAEMQRKLAEEEAIRVREERLALQRRQQREEEARRQEAVYRESQQQQQRLQEEARLAALAAEQKRELQNEQLRRQQQEEEEARSTAAARKAASGKGGGTATATTRGPQQEGNVMSATQAAVLAQAGFRRKHEPSTSAEKAAAAVLIQSVVRGYLTRKKVVALKDGASAANPSARSKPVAAPRTAQPQERLASEEQRRQLIEILLSTNISIRTIMESAFEAGYEESAEGKMVEKIYQDRNDLRRQYKERLSNASDKDRNEGAAILKNERRDILIKLLDSRDVQFTEHNVSYMTVAANELKLRMQGRQEQNPLPSVVPRVDHFGSLQQKGHLSPTGP